VHRAEALERGGDNYGRFLSPFDDDLEHKLSAVSDNEALSDTLTSGRWVLYNHTVI
jgi:hypothetical protein